MNKVTVRLTRLILRWMTIHGYTIFVFNQATQANSVWSWVGEMNTSDSYGYSWGRKWQSSA